MDNMWVRVLVCCVNDDVGQNLDLVVFLNMIGFVGLNSLLVIGIWGDGFNVNGNLFLVQVYWGGLIDDGGVWDIIMDFVVYIVLEIYYF